MTLTPAELARLAAVAVGLPAGEGALLRRLIDGAEPPWLNRQRRLAARDEAVRAARLHFPEPRPCVAAKALARALSGYLTSGWRLERERLPEGASEYRRALWRILTANNGKSLSWRRILEIWSV